MDDKSYNVRVPKRWARIALIVGATALIVAPLTAIAAHTFNDVPGSHTFHNDITWLADADVTKGCNPPDNTEYCPDDNVTRGQMAAFMKRFAGYIDAEDGTPAQADNADTVDGKNADVLADVTAAQSHDFFTTSNISLTADGTTIAETEIDVPADGHLVLMGNATVANDSNAFFTVWIELDEGSCELVNSDQPVNSVPGATAIAGSGANAYSTAVNGVATVNEGTHTATLCAASDTGFGGAVYASVIAQYTGEATTSVVTSGSSASGSGGVDN